MKTKIVYVVVSEEKDFFIEKAYISAYTCRLYNQNAQIILVTEPDTLNTCISGIRKAFLSLFDDVITVDASIYESNVKKSRFLKTTLPRYIKNDFLYIDCDTVICDSLSEIDDVKSNIAMIQDWNIDKDYRKVFWTDESRRKWNITIEDQNYYNGGVIYCKDAPESQNFFELWYEEWSVSSSHGLVYDQPPLHKVLRETKIKVESISGIWNCQIGGNFLPYFYKAKILHFHDPFLTKEPIHRLFDNEVYKAIKKENKINKDLLKIILNPKESFFGFSQIIGKTKSRFLISDLHKKNQFLMDNSRVCSAILRLVTKFLTFAYGITNHFGDTLIVVINKFKKHKAD